jgi:hypothetical protein
MEYKLQYVIETDDHRTKNTLTIKDRIKGADLLVMDEASGDVAKALRLIAKMCSISKYESEQLDSADIDALSEILAKKRQG